MRKIKRMFNIRYIALSFAFFILGIAFFTDLTAGISASRSEERRVGKECM